MGERFERPVNLVRQIAEDFLPSVMKKIEVDDNEANREDILALALNGLPTKYVTSGGGRLYAEVINNYKVQYQTDVVQALTRAAIKVKEHPREARKAGENK